MSLSHWLRPSASKIVLGVFACAASAHAADDQPAAAMICQINWVAPHTVYQTGEVMEDGSVMFVGEFTTPTDVWRMEWDLVARLNASDDVTVEGDVFLGNWSLHPIEFSLDLLLPVCPGLSGGTIVTGSSSITVTTDADGGYLTGDAGEYIWRATLDDEVIGQLFFGPYSQGSSGAGIFTSSGNFGVPFPGTFGPDSGSTLAVEINCHISAQDEAVVSSDFLIRPIAPRAGDCSIEADLNGDGVVNSIDLAILLGSWGPGISPADLNGDGPVDAVDLAIMLGAFTT